MKKIQHIFLILLAFVFFSCEKDEFYRPQTGGKPERAPLPAVNITSTNGYSFASLPSNPVFNFDLDFDVKDRIVSVNVLKRYRFVNDALTAFVTRADILHANVTSFPSTISIPITAMITGFNNRPNNAPLAIGNLRAPVVLGGVLTNLDTFELTFQVVYDDGRVLVYEAPYVTRGGVFQGQTILTIPVLN